MPVQGAAAEFDDGEKTVSVFSMVLVISVLAMLMGAFWLGHHRGMVAGRKQMGQS